MEWVVDNSKLVTGNQGALDQNVSIRAYGNSGAWDLQTDAISLASKALDAWNQYCKASDVGDHKEAYRVIRPYLGHFRLMGDLSPTERATVLSAVLPVLRINGDMDAAEDYSLALINMASKLKDQDCAVVMRAQGRFELAMVCHARGNSKLAIEMIDQALLDPLLIKPTRFEYFDSVSIGMQRKIEIHESKDDWKSASGVLRELITLVEGHRVPSGIDNEMHKSLPDLYGRLGVHYIGMDQYSEGLVFLSKAINMEANVCNGDVSRLHLMVEEAMCAALFVGEYRQALGYIEKLARPALGTGQMEFGTNLADNPFLVMASVGLCKYMMGAISTEEAMTGILSSIGAEISMSNKGEPQQSLIPGFLSYVFKCRAKDGNDQEIGKLGELLQAIEEHGAAD